MARVYLARELKHSGLNKYRIVKASTHYELEQKCSAIENQWDEQWKRKCESDKKRNDKAQQMMQAEECIKEANTQTTQAEKTQSELSSILIDRLNSELDISIKPFLRKDRFRTPMPRAKQVHTIPAEPLRADKIYNPPIGFFAKILGNEKRILAENDSKFSADYNNWTQLKSEIITSNERINDENDKMLCEWNNLKETFEKEKAEINKEIHEFWKDLEQGESDSINRYFENIIERVKWPIDYDNSFELEYIPDSKILILDYFVPAFEVIPNLKKVTFVKSQKEYKETYQTAAYMKKIYDQVVYQIVLSLLHVIFMADNQFNYIESVVINGKIATVDKSTGQNILPCILSASVKKDDFITLNLNNIDAKEWFKSNKGVSASTFSTITPVMPILQLNKEDARFVDGYSVVNEIDNTTNLASMDWQDFENLIKELFAKEFNQNGGEVKITQASRDGGVDAVAFDPDPIRGGKIVIQAKRYTNVVGVSAVRDLYGTVMNEGATKGILVTTANYGSDAYEFAKNKPLTLLTGANLLALLDKHGHKAKIDLKEAKEQLNN